MTIEVASLAVSKLEQDQNESSHDNRAQTLSPEPELEREVNFDSESDESTLSLDDDPRGLLWEVEANGKALRRLMNQRY